MTVRTYLHLALRPWGWQRVPPKDPEPPVVVVRTDPPPRGDVDLLRKGGME